MMLPHGVHLLALWVLTFVTSLFGAGLAVDPMYKMGDPMFFGSGCPTDTVTVVPSSDYQSISIRFSAFSASTTPQVNRDRKSCNLVLPVSVIPGISIGIFQVDYHGYAYVPPRSNAYTEFQANYFFAGSSGPTYKKTWKAGFDEDLNITNKFGVSAIVWSLCDQSTNLRISTSLMAYKLNLSDPDPQIAINTTDVTIERGFRFFVTFKPCTL